MAQQQLNNGDSGLNFRNKLNANFTELFEHTGVTNHAELTNLDYASSGHTGFARTSDIPDAAGLIAAHNTSATAHNDIRTLIANLAFVASVNYNETTGIMTFTMRDGTTESINIVFSELLKGFDIDTVTKEIIAIREDGSEIRISIADLMPVYEGSNGTHIQITIGTGNVINAVLKAGTVTETELSSGVVTKLNGAATAADLSSLANRVTIVESDVVDAQTTATNAQTAAGNAQTTANAAIPLTQKGAANGVATLGSDSKIPASQLPESSMSVAWGNINNIPQIIGDVVGLPTDDDKQYLFENGTLVELPDSTVYNDGETILGNGSVSNPLKVADPLSLNEMNVTNTLNVQSTPATPPAWSWENANSAAVGQSVDAVNFDPNNASWLPGASTIPTTVPSFVGVGGQHWDCYIVGDTLGNRLRIQLYDTSVGTPATDQRTLRLWVMPNGGTETQLVPVILQAGGTTALGGDGSWKVTKRSYSILEILGEPTGTITQNDFYGDTSAWGTQPGIEYLSNPGTADLPAVANIDTANIGHLIVNATTGTSYVPTADENDNSNTIANTHFVNRAVENSAETITETVIKSLGDTISKDANNALVLGADDKLFVPQSGGGTGDVEEAPDDGQSYVRQSKDWTVIRELTPSEVQNVIDSIWGL